MQIFEQESERRNRQMGEEFEERIKGLDEDMAKLLDQNA